MEPLRSSVLSGLASVALLAVSGAALGSVPETTPCGEGASQSSAARTTPHDATRDTKTKTTSPASTRPETARDSQKTAPESARDDQKMTPATARDDQKLTPESATADDW